jgi:multiple sugar transport system substrate-binding protein
MKQAAGRRGLTWAAGAAIVVTGALALTGCSGGSVTGNSNGSSGGKTTITVWHEYTGSGATEAQAIANEFNKSQDKYTVQLQFASNSDQLDAKLINALKNKTGPNLMLGDSTPQGLGQVISTGDVVPLDTDLDASGSSITKSDFTSGMLSTGTFNNKVYSLVTDVGDFAVVYNKQMFKDAGITSTPTTWAEFASDAATLTKGTTQYGAYLPIGTGEWPVFTWQAMLWSAGGEFLNADNTQAEFNSPAGVKALTAWTDMVSNHSAYPQSLATSSDGNGTGAMTSKKVAMEINGAYNLATLDSALGADNVGVFALPGVSQPGMNLGTDNSYILKGTSAQEAGSWSFLQYWLKPSVQAKWDIATGYFPANSHTADDASWKAYLAKNPRVATFVNELSYAKARPSIDQYGEVSAALSTQIEEAMLLKESPSAALASAAQAADKALQ